MYMQRTTSGAASNGLYTTIKCMRGAAGIGLGATIKHLRRTTSGTAGNGLSAKLKLKIGLKNIFEIGQPYSKKLLMINNHSAGFIEHDPGELRVFKSSTFVKIAKIERKVQAPRKMDVN
jgi:hypothetical protein